MHEGGMSYCWKVSFFGIFHIWERCKRSFFSFEEEMEKGVINSNKFSLDEDVW